MNKNDIYETIGLAVIGLLLIGFRELITDDAAPGHTAQHKAELTHAPISSRLHATDVEYENVQPTQLNQNQL